MEFSFVGLSDVGRVRSQNQDSIHQPASAGAGAPVFVLADGMGGARGGEVASQLAVASIPASYALARASLGSEEALRQAVATAASAIHRRALEQPELKGMGTTTVALVLEDERAILANVGDSRGYLWRGGQLMQVTQDHSLVQRLVAEGSITPQEARHHHMRNVLTRVLGNAPDVEVDLYDLALMPGDRLLLCSDGLHGPVEDEEIARVLASPGGLEQQARELVEAANGRGGPDNISVILVAVETLETERAEATFRRTQVAAPTMAPTAPISPPDPEPAKPAPKGKKTWLVVSLLIVLAGGLFLWSVMFPASTPKVRGKVELTPLGPTTDSQATSPASEKEPAKDAPKEREARP